MQNSIISSKYYLKFTQVTCLFKLAISSQVAHHISTLSSHISGLLALTHREIKGLKMKVEGINECSSFGRILTKPRLWDLVVHIYNHSTLEVEGGARRWSGTSQRIDRNQKPLWVRA